MFHWKKIIVAGMVTLPVLMANMGAQRAEHSQLKQPVILEVVATQYEFAPEWSYLYLRVFSDGHAEAQSVSRKSVFEKPDLRMVERSLPKEDFREIQRLMEDDSVSKLDARYPQRMGGLLDVFDVWTVTVRHSNNEQQLQIVAFAPKQAKYPYPDSLVKLGCAIRRARADVIGDSSCVDPVCSSQTVPYAKSCTRLLEWPFVHNE